MTDTERLYRVRSRSLLDAAGAEHDPTLRLALCIQSQRIGMKALALELARKRIINPSTASWRRVRGFIGGRIIP